MCNAKEKDFSRDWRRIEESQILDHEIWHLEEIAYQKIIQKNRAISEQLLLPYDNLNLSLNQWMSQIFRDLCRYFLPCENVSFPKLHDTTDNFSTHDRVPKILQSLPFAFTKNRIVLSIKRMFINSNSAMLLKILTKPNSKGETLEDHTVVLFLLFNASLSHPLPLDDS